MPIRVTIEDPAVAKAYLARRPNLEVVLRDGAAVCLNLREHRAWTDLFDPATPQMLKAALRSALHTKVEEERNRHALAMGASEADYILRQRLSTIQNAIIGMVMVSGMGYGCRVLANAQSKDRFFLIGYSSGNKDTSKLFADGTSMAGRAYVPEDYVWLLRENSAAPIVLADNLVISGHTVRAVESALRGIGHTGPLYITYTDKLGIGAYPAIREMDEMWPRYRMLGRKGITLSTECTAQPR
jgi:hypothetical protein